MAQSARADRFHFIGIGGEGMTALAEILLDRGRQVSGSDVHANANTERLRQHGARVAIGHDRRNLDGATTVVYNTAIHEDNCELVAARERGLRVLHRSELLQQLLEGTQGIAVSGTHGKTTTTAMLALVLRHGGLDPSLAAGGEVRNLGLHGHAGRGRHLVFEACESDASFLQYPGCSQIITNVEPDHLDQHGSFEALCDRFRDFVRIADPNGFVVYCAAGDVLAGVVGETPAHLVSYALGRVADFRAESVQVQGFGVAYDLVVRGQPWGPVALRVPGRHNVANSLAAIAAAEAVGVEVGTAVQALGEFAGVKRRFELIYEGEGIMVVDDYAHHPTEVRATLQAAREGFGRHLVCVFQPHLFSRTKILMDDFGRAFRDADEVILTSIYAAREQPMEGVDGRQLLEAVRANQPATPACYLEHLDEIVRYLAEPARPGDMVLTLGAGNVREVSLALAEELRGRPAPPPPATTATNAAAPSGAQTQQLMPPHAEHHPPRG